ncbi:MAG: TonB-dependent receptor, partial [Acidobacteria bacterium]|nr:TonB-dependent receptor [Acidobacteriota bacterium]
WFQNPNTWDQQLQDCSLLSPMCNASRTHEVNPATGLPLGPTDQRSQIRTFNISPSFVHVVSTSAVWTMGAYVRHDQYNYYPSKNPFNDLGPLQDESVSQMRFLTNAGGRTDLTYVHGSHNIKVGANYMHTFLTEHDAFGIVNPGLLSSCPAQFAAQCGTLAPFDLTAGGRFSRFLGHTDVKELALYAEDNISKGPVTLNLGMRGDLYNGLDAVSRQPEPRAGFAYNLKKTSSVLQVSYARTMETPFNENLILSGLGCLNSVVNAIMTVAQGFNCTGAPLQPGFRNEFHAGLEQAFGSHFVINGEYIWKYTHNGYDFNIFGTTPIFMPIEWHNSKIPGFAIRGTMPQWHGLMAFVVMSHVAARFFPPTVAGIGPPQPPAVFRIDHDEAFNETTHIQYQPWKRGPWLGFNWRFDSGLVSGAVPCEAQTATCSFTTSALDPGGQGLANIPAGSVALLNNLNGLPLTADQQFQAGLRCNGVPATPTTPTGILIGGVYTCPATQLTSNLIKIPGPNQEQDDKHPQRIAPRHLFDVALGDDNLFNTERYKWSARVSVINLANGYVLYNFLSTFSGTHYVTPRTITAELGFHF